MQRALDGMIFHNAAVGERKFLVGAGVADGVQLAIDVVDADRLVIYPDTQDRARWQVFFARDLDRRHISNTPYCGSQPLGMRKQARQPAMAKHIHPALPVLPVRARMVGWTSPPSQSTILFCRVPWSVVPRVKAVTQLDRYTPLPAGFILR